MTNIASIATNWRTIGDTSLNVYRAEFSRVKSPMLPDVDAIYEATKPHSALILAHSWMENQHNTTNIEIPKDAHNFLALRPEYPGEKGPFGSGVVYTERTGQFLRFASFADCVREWHRRTWKEATTYKGYGPYKNTTTLESYLAVYAPAGDIHGVTGKDNADIGYARTVTTMLERFKKQEDAMSDSSDLASELTDVLTDIVQGIGKGPSPHGVDALDPDTEVVPAVVIPALENAPDDQLVIRWGRDMFFRVGRKMVAIRPTPRYQRAVLGGPVTGDPLDAGDFAFIDWAWITYDGHLWLMSDWDTRFFGPDFLLVDTLEPLPVPDPGPVVPAPEPTPPVIEPDLPAFMLVDDPWTLLPPIEWVGSPNFFPNRSGFGKPIAMVDHITDDMNLSRVLGWLRNPASQASAHFVIDRNGKVYQLVSSADGAFTNGKVDRPRTDIPVILDVVRRGINFNNATITVEHVGTPNNPPTQAQYEASRKIHQYFSHPKVYGIIRNRSHQLRHGDIDSVDRSYCPGNDFDLAGTIRALGGDPNKLD